MMSNPERQKLVKTLHAIYTETHTRSEFVAMCARAMDAPDDLDAAMIWEAFEEASERALDAASREYQQRVADIKARGIRNPILTIAGACHCRKR